MLRRRLQQLLCDDSGSIHPQLQALHDHLAQHERPVLVWLNKRGASQTLAELAVGKRPLTHDALDELPDSKPLRHLRSVLVSIGALPARDEQMFRLERWIDTMLAERLNADERQLLHRYAIWHVLRRLRGRLRGAHATYEQVVAARRNITAAIALLDWLADPAAAGQVPLLLAISDNGPQMRSYDTRELLAAVAIAQQFGRPHTPQDQAWIETLFGHVKGEWPHLEKINDPGQLERELDRVRHEYDTVRVHEGIGYVTPDDEHHGRGTAIRAARRAGLATARQQRLATNREPRKDHS